MGRILHLGDAAGLVRDDVLKHVADFTRIGEVLLPEHLSGDDAGADLLLRLLFHDIIILLAVEVEDLLELIDRVVRELDILVEPGLESGIAVDELLHGLCIARDDDNQVVSVVLHSLEDRVDGFLAESVILLGQRISFVDEENAAHRFFDLFLGLEGRLSHVACHKAGAVDFDQLSFGQHSDLLVEPSDDPGDRRLAGSGISRKDKVKGYRDRFKSLVLSHLLYFGKSHDLLDVFLDGREADQGVKFLHGVLLGLGGLGRLSAFGLSSGRRRGGLAALAGSLGDLAGHRGGISGHKGRIYASRIPDHAGEFIKALFVGVSYSLGDLVRARHEFFRFFERFSGVLKGIGALFSRLVEELRGTLFS